ncbi:MAG: ATPase [Chloroflexales bacterium]|nr:ATPase [Chloroflexales bacterium]
MSDLFLGIDVGSTTVKVVVIDPSTTLHASRYLRAQGRPSATLLQALRDLAQELDFGRVVGVGLTGSGGERIAQQLGGRHVNELVAQTRALSAFHPEARSVIEIGGQDSKYLDLEWDAAQGRLVIRDFAMNAVCAAGTGSFLDQQAERLGIAIEGEFGALAAQSQSPARIAGRCTVFAKSDMIHLQQRGTPLPDILAGLCLALARNFKGVISKGKAFTPPIIFQGGVAYNQGVVRAFEHVLDLQPGQLIIPRRHELMAAIGTALLVIDTAAELAPAFQGFAALEELAHAEQSNHKPLPALSSCAFALPAYDTSTIALPAHDSSPITLAPATDVGQGPGASGNGRSPAGTHAPQVGAAPLPVYLGIDVGSISTNLVLIDERHQVVARRYLATAGQPLEAVRRGLHELWAEAGARVTVRGVGTTGSGRYLTADFVGGDVVRNEITAQVRAATAIDPEVDTIFEIGGQDSKYIRVSHGTVVDFTMNNACAAGTGSFLEEQAERLSLDVTTEFSALALGAARPTGLGERCTVFMESDVIHHQQQGAGLDQLTAGLAYAIAENYLHRVVNNRAIGKKVFFQGGVAWNQSVVAAFQTLLERPVIVPPHHDVTGAIGVAILAHEALAERERAGENAATRFKGFDLSARHYETSTFECRACPNLCEVSKITIAGEPPIFYGARCDIFEELGQRQAQASRLARIPDLFAERATLLLGDYAPPSGPRSGRPRVGLPRALTTFDFFAYWRTFFAALDVEVVLSEPTSAQILRATLAHAEVESCLPARLLYGHALDLAARDVDVILLPSVIDREDLAQGQRESNTCTFIAAAPYLARAHLARTIRTPLLVFSLHMRDTATRQRDLRALAGELGVAPERVAAADAAAIAAQEAFYAAIRHRGREVLANLNDEQPAVVLVGRSYNTADLEVCQDLPYKLRKLGVLPIPFDFLPLDTINIAGHYPNVCAPSGGAVIAAGLIIRDDPRLNAIYVTNFCCNPDAFFLGFFREILGAKPFLELELDEHTADTGVITRCEAFLDSLRLSKGVLL